MAKPHRFSTKQVIDALRASKGMISVAAQRLQKAADTQLIPPLIVQLDHLEAGVIPLRMAVIHAQGQLPRTGPGLCCQSFLTVLSSIG